MALLGRKRVEKRRLTRENRDRQVTTGTPTAFSNPAACY